MPINNPPATLRTLALECVQRITRDLTDPSMVAGMSPQVEAARYAAMQSWARTGQEIATGQWDDARLAEFVRDCLGKWDTCEAVLSV